MGNFRRLFLALVVVFLTITNVSVAKAQEGPLVLVLGDYGMQTCIPPSGKTDQWGRCGKDSVGQVLQRIFRNRPKKDLVWKRARVLALTSASSSASTWLVPRPIEECPSLLTADPGFPFSGLRKAACDAGQSQLSLVSTFLGEVPDYVLINFSTGNSVVAEVDAIQQIATTLATEGAAVYVSTPLRENSANSTFPWREALALELESRGLVNGPNFFAMELPRHDSLYLSPEGSRVAAGLWWGVLQTESEAP